MVYKVPYTKDNLYFRPYLGVYFVSHDLKKNSSHTLAVLDSGADSIMIPFSMGVTLGFSEPNEAEFLSASGIGGDLSYIERKCHVFLSNVESNEWVGFEHEVSWSYPSPLVQKEVTDLIEQHENYKKMEQEAKMGTNLIKYIQSKKQETFAKVKKRMDLYETPVLLGRDFFHNFEFMQFIQKGKDRETQSAIHYSLRSRSIKHRIAMPTSVSTIQKAI